MNPKLLVIDDDLSVLESLAKLLRSEGYDVLSARNGIQALDLFKSSPVKLVVLDINLGMDDGWNVFHAMTALNPFVPTVVITGKAGQAARATAAGVEALIEKPIDVPIFLAVIRDLLNETSEQRIERICGTDQYCRYVARTYEAYLRRLQEQSSAPMKLSPELHATLPASLKFESSGDSGDDLSVHGKPTAPPEEFMARMQSPLSAVRGPARRRCKKAPGHERTTEGG